MYDGPKIDCDVHHNWASESELVPFLPKKWRDFVALPGGRTLSLIQPQQYFPTADGVYRLDAVPPSGGPPASDYETLRAQLLDGLNIEHAVLSYDIGLNAGLRNIYLATALVSAMNDWSIDRWLSLGDARLYGALLVPTQSPTDAAKEVRRLGKHPRMAEVLLVINGLGKPFGHPIYHPIYKAAAEVGLPVAIHIGGDLAPAYLGTAGGILGSRFERHVNISQPIHNHLASFISHGVFEKFSDLHLILVEVGVAWIPWVLQELDAHYESLRRESPWVKRLPSDYFREHVRVTTQPLEMTPKRSQLIEYLEAFGGMEDILCFSTDYPHWDADDPTYIATRLPPAWLEKVFYKNACKLYGWAASQPANQPTSLDPAGRMVEQARG
jgi:predicted TIM-barrel fold metal-dependent hydrolase